MGDGPAPDCNPDADRPPWSCTLTILTALHTNKAKPRPLLTKRHVMVAGEVQTEPYDRAYEFSVRTVTVRSIAELLALLQEVANDPHSCFIRGTPNAGTNQNRTRRLKALFGDQGTGWVAADFDSVALINRLTGKPYHPVDDVELIGAELRQLLPPEFRKAACLVHLTSGAGIKGGIRARLWFLLSRPLIEIELKTWLASKLVDPSTLLVVEPIYTASPIFIGMADPCAAVGRWHLLHGDELPDNRNAAAKAIDTGYHADGTKLDPADYLAAMGDHKEGTGFHQPIKSYVASIAHRFRGSGLAERCEQVKDNIRRAIADAPKRPDRGDDLERYAGDKFLDELIASAIVREAPRDAERAAEAAASKIVGDQFRAGLARKAAAKEEAAKAAAAPKEAHRPDPGSETSADDEAAAGDAPWRRREAGPQPPPDQQGDPGPGAADSRWDFSSADSDDGLPWLPDFPAENLQDLATASVRLVDELRAFVAYVQPPHDQFVVDMQQYQRDLKQHYRLRRPEEEKPPKPTVEHAEDARCALIGDPGIGKTTSLIALLAALKRCTGSSGVAAFYKPGLPFSVDYYVTTAAAGDELEALCRKHGLPARFYRGRGAIIDGNPLCQRHEEVAALAAMGERVAESACYTFDYVTAAKIKAPAWIECPHFYDCRFTTQYMETSEAAGAPIMIRIYLHQRVVAQGPGHDDLRQPEPGLNVIDEGFLKAALETVTLPLDRLTAYIPEGVRDRARELVGGALEEGQDPVAAVGDRAPLVKVLAVAYEEEQSNTLSPDMPDAALRAGIATMQQSEVVKLGKFWRLLLEEVALARPAQRIVMVPNVAQAQGAPRHEAHLYLRKAMVLEPEVPLLLLDGSYSAPIMAKFAPPLHEVRIAVKRNIKLIQVTDTVCARFKLAPDLTKVGSMQKDPSDRKKAAARAEITARNNRAEVMRAALLARRQGRVLVIIYRAAVIEIAADYGIRITEEGGFKALRAELEARTGIEFCHPNASRGLDRHRGVRSVFLACRNEPTAPDLEIITRAVFGDDEQTLNLTGSYTDMARAYVTKDGSERRAGIVKGHVEPRSQLLLEQIREQEGVQLLDRGRGVQHVGEPILVVNRSNVPLPLPVDEFATTAEVEIEWHDQLLAALGGVALLSLSEVQRMAETNGIAVPSQATIERHLARLRAAGFDSIKRHILYRSMAFDGVKISYRRTGAVGGPPLKCWVFGCSTAAEALDRLAVAGLGPIKTLEITIHSPAAEHRSGSVKAGGRVRLASSAAA